MLSVDYVRWGLGSVVLCCLLGVLSRTPAGEADRWLGSGSKFEKLRGAKARIWQAQVARAYLAHAQKPFRG